MPDLDNTWFNNWPDGLIGVDKDNRIVELSPMARAILGWTINDLYDFNPHDMLCADASGYSHSYGQCPLICPQHDNETRSTLLQHKNGHHISVDVRHIPVGYDKATRLISVIDNSSRQHTQAEMQKFSEFVEMSPAPLAEFVMSGQMLYGNTAMQELLLEYGFDESGRANVIPENIVEIGNILLEMETPYYVHEASIENRVFTWHFHLIDHDDRITIVGYAFDISAQKAAELAAKEQQAQARKEFYAKMIHELRTPLNAIIGFSDLLLSTTSDRLEQEELNQLGLIKSAGEQLNQQVTDTLDVAKIESGKMTLDISEVCVADVCHSVFEHTRGLAAEKQLDFKIHTATKKNIFSDLAKVRQVVLNLVSNAIKYTHVGKVQVIVGEKQHDPIGDCISVRVVDTGIGIAHENIPKLFRSFEQIDEEQTKHVEGTGLGLTLVYNLLQLLGGKILVDSQHGKGSTFEVLLPFLNQN